MSQKVSVIMPAYNAEKYIQESINSVINQTYKNWELIIINDGSQDLTGQIADYNSKRDNRIKCIHQTNQKQGIARNNGIRLSTGEYIAFLDADDLWLDNKLAISINEFENNNFDLLFTDTFVFEGNVPDQFHGLKNWGIENEVFSGDDAIIKFMHANKIPNLTVIVKKSVLIEAGPFTKIAKAEEYEMWLRLLAKGYIFKSIKQTLSLYRIHAQSITANDRNSTFELMLIIIDFAHKNARFLSEAKSIVNANLRYWLYHGANRSNKNFRLLIKRLNSNPKNLLFYFLTFLMPFDLLKKFIIRLI